MADKIADLLATEPKEVIKNISPLFGWDYCQLHDIHVPEVYGVLGDVDMLALEKVETDEIEIHEFHRRVEDYRRFHVIFGVKFRGEWVMVCRNAGREGDDHSSRFILDVDRYREMVVYVSGVVARVKVAEALQRDDGKTVVVAPDGEVEDLYEFYGEDVRYPRYRW